MKVSSLFLAPGHVARNKTCILPCALGKHLDICTFVPSLPQVAMESIILSPSLAAQGEYLKLVGIEIRDANRRHLEKGFSNIIHFLQKQRLSVLPKCDSIMHLDKMPSC
jgi:hypothetical protein